MAQAGAAAPAVEFAHLLPPSWEQEIPRWLAADVPKFDVGGFVVGEKTTTATILGKSPGILAGVPFVDAIFAFLGCTVDWECQEVSCFLPCKAECVSI